MSTTAGPLEEALDTIVPTVRAMSRRNKPVMASPDDAFTTALSEVSRRMSQPTPSGQSPVSDRLRDTLVPVANGMTPEQRKRVWGQVMSYQQDPAWTPAIGCPYGAKCNRHDSFHRFTHSTPNIATVVAEFFLPSERRQFKHPRKQKRAVTFKRGKTPGRKLTSVRPIARRQFKHPRKQKRAVTFKRGKTVRPIKTVPRKGKGGAFSRRIKKRLRQYRTRRTRHHGRT